MTYELTLIRLFAWCLKIEYILCVTEFFHVFKHQKLLSSCSIQHIKSKQRSSYVKHTTQYSKYMKTNVLTIENYSLSGCITRRRLSTWPHSFNYLINSKYTLRFAFFRLLYSYRRSKVYIKSLVIQTFKKPAFAKDGRGCFLAKISLAAQINAINDDEWYECWSSFRENHERNLAPIKICVRYRLICDGV